MALKSNYFIILLYTTLQFVNHDLLYKNNEPLVIQKDFEQLLTVGLGIICR